MKKRIKVFAGLYLAFLLVGVACDDNCGPFDDTYTITGLVWEVPSSQNTPINYQEFYIYVRPEGAFFNSTRTANSFSLISKTYACDPVPPETNDRLINLEITANRDFSPAYPQGVNLIDLFDVNVTYFRGGRENVFSLNDFVLSNPKFPDAMTMQLKEAPAAGEDFVFTLKFNIDGTDINYAEFNTDDVTIVN